MFSQCCVVTLILLSALNERVFLGTFIIYSIYISMILFPIAASWVYNSGWLHEIGFIDYSGAAVVHLVAGVGSLIGSLIVGPRLDIHNSESIQ